MKTILTLFISFITISTFAQSDAEREEAKRVILGERKGSTSTPKQDEDRDIILGGDNRTVYGDRNRRYPESYPTTSGTARERQVYEINRAYDQKIYSIRNNSRLSRSEKERIIRQLERDRRYKIEQVNNRYYGNNERSYENRDTYKKDKRYKTNKGNHYGWERGKGNPHKGRS